MLLISPAIFAFQSGSPHIHKQGLNASFVHANSWESISHYHFTTPAPIRLAIKDLAIIFYCIGFLLFTSSNRTAALRSHLYKYPVIPGSSGIYLLIRTLLIWHKQKIHLIPPISMYLIVSCVLSAKNRNRAF